MINAPGGKSIHRFVRRVRRKAVWLLFPGTEGAANPAAPDRSGCQANGGEWGVGVELSGHDALTLAQLPGQRCAAFRRIEHCHDFLQPIKSQRLGNVEIEARVVGAKLVLFAGPTRNGN